MIELPNPNGMHLSMCAAIPDLPANTPSVELKIPVGDGGYAYLKMPDQRVLSHAQVTYVLAFLDTAKQQMHLQLALSQAQAKAELNPLDLSDDPSLDASDRMILECVAQMESATRQRLAVATGMVYEDMLTRMNTLIEHGYLLSSHGPDDNHAQATYTLPRRQ